MFQEIIQKRKNEWLASASSSVTDTIRYIRQKKALREPQIEAIETYLFLKIGGQNRPIWELIESGFLDKKLDLQKLKANDPVEILLKADREVLKKAFYGVDYTDYLFSLPMGAGKTFLMASFMYLDLYFAQNEPQNPVFAHNFIVLAPSGLKSSIVPSLRTIEHFDPTWVLPEPSASQLKRLLKFEVLDLSKSASKSNRTKNPNVHKIANFQPLADQMGLVLVANAEKVILDKVRVDKNWKLIEETQDEKEKAANELRHWIGNIPNLAILIDEVHHAATDDIKLRQVVNYWHSKGTVTNVLGFSGTPYLAKPEKIDLNEKNTLKITQITNTVFYYPLLKAVQSFLKKPLVKVEKGEKVQTLDIIRTGVKAFYEQFGKTIYADGTCAKLAIYCSHIEKLEEIVYPFLLSEMQIKPEEILKYHQGNKKYTIRKEAQSEFLALDTPFSTKKVILLVQIGKEGWDCRSLTGVILSQKGDCPTNMVLQTACRCLRQNLYPEGTKIPEKTALICLNEDNEKSLDKQLKDEQQISLAELGNAKSTEAKPTRPRQSRMDYLELPAKIDLWKMEVKYETYFTENEPNTIPKLKALQGVELQEIQTLDRDLENSKDKLRGYRSEEKGESISFDYWLLQISKESFSGVSMADLRKHTELLQLIFKKITLHENGQTFLNERYPIGEIQAGIRKAFYQKRSLSERAELIKESVEWLLVQNLKPIEIYERLLPTEKEENHIRTAEMQQKTVSEFFEGGNATLETVRKQLIEQGLEDMANALPFQKPTLFEKNKDKTFHFLPYSFDSKFEMAFLENVLQDRDFQELQLEVYFNGERHITDFKITCYQKNKNSWQKIGEYCPDFLIIQRNSQTEIHKILIAETKGEGFAENFKSKRNFMETEFLRINNEKFGYNRFDFLYVQDNDPNWVANLNRKIKSFFVA